MRLPRSRHTVHRMVAFDGLLKIFTLWNTGQERRGSVGSTQVMKQCYEDTREATPTLGATEVSCALLGGIQLRRYYAMGEEFAKIEKLSAEVLRLSRNTVLFVF